MTKAGMIFKFNAPNDWKHSEERDREIFHGPNNEELIVSGSIIQGFGKTKVFDEIRQQIFDNAEQSVKLASAHPSLTVTQSFKKEFQTENAECWSLRAQTHAGETLFYQAVFLDLRGVLIVTLEAPNNERSIEFFLKFIKSVKVNDSNR